MLPLREHLLPASDEFAAHQQCSLLGWDGWVFLGRGGVEWGAGAVATLAAGSQLLSKSSWPYSEAVTSAPAKKPVQEQVDPALCPYHGERG